MAFRGLYEHSLDSKDRLTVPSGSAPRSLTGSFSSKGFDPCVWVLHDRRVATAARPLPLAATAPSAAKGRLLRRRFHGGSFDEKLDSAGRIRDRPSR